MARNASLICALGVVALIVSGEASANDSATVVQRAEHALTRAAEVTAHGLKRGFQAAAHGIEIGAKATGHGLQRAGEAVGHAAEKTAEKAREIAGR